MNSMKSEDMQGGKMMGEERHFRVCELGGKKVHIGYFMKPIYFTGEKTKELREFMGKKYKFKKGFVFNAK